MSRSLSRSANLVLAAAGLLMACGTEPGAPGDVNVPDDASLDGSDTLTDVFDSGDAESDVDAGTGDATPSPMPFDERALRFWTEDSALAHCVCTGPFDRSRVCQREVVESCPWMQQPEGALTSLYESGAFRAELDCLNRTQASAYECYLAVDVGGTCTESNVSVCLEHFNEWETTCGVANIAW